MNDELDKSVQLPKEHNTDFSDVIDEQIDQQRLNEMKDEDIDCSDIPVTDFSQGVRGKYVDQVQSDKQPSINSSDEIEPQKLDQPVLESIPSEEGIERTICIRCKRRVARKRDVFCSRCSARKMQADLQNPLDKTQPIPRDKDQMSDAPAPQVQLVERPTSNMYNRREAAKVLGVSHNTLRRWEGKGYIDPPKRFIHSKECFYTDEHIQKIRDFMAQERNVPLPEGATLLERPVNRERSSMPVKSFSRKLEKTVAKSLNLGFRGKGLL